MQIKGTGKLLKTKVDRFEREKLWRNQVLGVFKAKKKNKPRSCLDVSLIWPEPPQAKIDVIDFYKYLINGIEVPIMTWYEKPTKSKINSTVLINGWVRHQSRELKSGYHEIDHKVIQKQMSINRILTLLFNIFKFDERNWYSWTSSKREYLDKERNKV